MHLLGGHRTQVGDRSRLELLRETHAGFLRLFEWNCRERAEHRAAFADRAGDQAFDSGDAICALTANEPADSPAIVTFFGSPPNAAMLSRTHCKAADWSSRA